MGRLIHRGFFRQGDIHDENTSVPQELGNKMVATGTEWRSPSNTVLFYI